MALPLDERRAGPSGPRAADSFWVRRRCRCLEQTRGLILPHSRCHHGTSPRLRALVRRRRPQPLGPTAAATAACRPRGRHAAAVESKGGRARGRGHRPNLRRSAPTEQEPPEHLKTTPHPTGPYPADEKCTLPLIRSQPACVCVTTRERSTPALNASQDGVRAAASRTRVASSQAMPRQRPTAMRASRSAGR